MAHRLNATVHLDGEVYSSGQVVDGEVEDALAKSWGDRDDLWEAVEEPKAKAEAPKKQAAK